MKKIIFSALLSSFIFSHSVFADNTACIVIGFHQPGTNTYDGPTFFDQVNLKGIVVRGPFEINQSAITEETDISGPVRSTRTTFDDIVMENNHSPETVYLKQNSLVKNNIVFEGSNRGTVVLDSTSFVKGKVINGDIVGHR